MSFVDPFLLTVTLVMTILLIIGNIYFIAKLLFKRVSKLSYIRQKWYYKDIGYEKASCLPNQ